MRTVQVPWFAVDRFAEIVRSRDGAVFTLIGRGPGCVVLEPGPVVVPVDPNDLVTVRIPELAEAMSTIWRVLGPYEVLAIEEET
jgi:hypothetical protein